MSMSLLTLVLLSGLAKAEPSVPPTDVSTDLALKLFRSASAQDPDENAVLCPLGVMQMLAQVQLGAGGSTLQQLRRAMHPKDAKSGKKTCFEYNP